MNKYGYSPSYYKEKILPERLSEYAEGTVILRETQENFTGTGYFAGKFPLGITTVEGVPVSANVRIIYRANPGMPGDGYVVAEAQSASDGTWRIDGLNSNFEYDVVGRKDGLNDVIQSRVRPAQE